MVKAKTTTHLNRPARTEYGDGFLPTLSRLSIFQGATASAILLKLELTGEQAAENQTSQNEILDHIERRVLPFGTTAREAFIEWLGRMRALGTEFTALTNDTPALKVSEIVGLKDNINNQMLVTWQLMTILDNDLLDIENSDPGRAP